MARKVLISFLGTGSFNPKMFESREYKTVNYHLGDKDLGNYPFVAAAIRKYYSIETVLLVGTAHSMWEDVYRWFSGERASEDVYIEIGTASERATNKSPLEVPRVKEIEQALGGDSKVVLIRYGLTEEEIRENVNIILGLQDYLQREDELIVDITHAFRSLPIFLMNLLIYLQNVSSKKIRISHIHYGMLDIIKELGYAPIIDLRSMMDVQEWITGAYNLKEFGNAYKIADLLEGENKSVASILRNFSDAMNLNYLYSMQAETQKLSGVKDSEYVTDLPRLIINPVVESFVRNFTINTARHRQSLYQLKMTEWQLEHKKYAQAYLTSNDALITYVCELMGWPWDDFDQRQEAKNLLRDRNSSVTTQEMREWFKRHNNRRNGIAHTMKVLDVFYKKRERHERPQTMREIIEALKKDIEELKDLIKA